MQVLHIGSSSYGAGDAGSKMGLLGFRRLFWFQIELYLVQLIASSLPKQISLFEFVLLESEFLMNSISNNLKLACTSVCRLVTVNFKVLFAI